jgi:hypothetical protein
MKKTVCSANEVEEKWQIWRRKKKHNNNNKKKIIIRFSVDNTLQFSLYVM